LLDFEGQDAVSHRKSLPGENRGQGIASMQKRGWGLLFPQSGTFRASTGILTRRHFDPNNKSRSRRVYALPFVG
jgi:hypothetical protein